MSSITYEFIQLNTGRTNLDELSLALNVYVRNTAPSLRTETNEIVHWAQEYNKQFNDRLYLFALKAGGTTIGYSECVYFKDPRIIAIDYICVDEGYKDKSAFYVFLDFHIDFFERHCPDWRMMTTELGYLSHTDEPSEASRSLSRLLKWVGFKVAKHQYFQPKLEPKNHESIMKADLMIYTKDASETITSETFLDIVRTLYFDHYMRWDKPFFEQNPEHTQHIEDLYEKISSSIKGKKVVALNGTSAHYNALPPVNIKQESLSLKAAPHVLIMMAIYSLLVMLGRVLDIGITPSILLLFAVAAVYFAVTGLYHDKGERLSGRFLGGFKSLSGKKESPGQRSD